MADDDALKSFYDQAFPGVSAEVRARFRSFLASQNPDYKWLYAGGLQDSIRQGDILYALAPFFFDGAGVKIGKEQCPFMMLEHSCDLQKNEEKPRNSNYIFTPLLPFTKIKHQFKDTAALEKNIISTKIYLGHIPNLEDAYIADLDMIGSVSASWFHNAIDQKQIRRVASLSDNGFYFLLAKLSVHLLRAN